jgi:AraC-like DNA-binding protein
VKLLASPHVDDVSALLEQINVRSVVYCRSDFGAPWGFRVDGSATAKFHLVLDGCATLTLGDRTTGLSAGELVLLAHGSAHHLQNGPGSATPPLDQILAGTPVDTLGRLAYGGDGPRTSLLCGGFELSSGIGLFTLLPPLLVLNTADTDLGRWLEPVFALVEDRGPGATAVLTKVADVFLTQIVRSYLSGLHAVSVEISPASARDPAVGTALTMLRLQPNAPWTVADLARKVDMSRTAFAARFRELVGEPPMGYLSRLRLGHAAGYLSATDKTVQEIARIVGYDNESSLSKAFRRAFGQAPGEYRRQQRAASSVQATFGA